MPAWLNQIISVFKKNKVEPVVAEPEEEVCCSGIVKIAYRGVSDDRLYLAEGRKWGDVRFFKPNGLRVFCAGCRRRLL
ncbi:hypothetical protein BH10CYA1_BH10CYA1_20640 [soil metagenome]